MKKLILGVAAILVTSLGLFPGAAQADPNAQHRSGGLGFHNTDAPVGLRWWFAGQRVGVDLGFGYRSSPAPFYADEKVQDWTMDAGVPIVATSWERVHVLFRPGIVYDSEERVVSGGPPAAFETDDQTTFNITAELEAEVFLADNFSVSAAHGIAFQSINPIGDGDNINSFTTLGRNFTTVGFHVYFFGGTE